MSDHPDLFDSTRKLRHQNWVSGKPSDRLGAPVRRRQHACRSSAGRTDDDSLCFSLSLNLAHVMPNIKIPHIPPLPLPGCNWPVWPAYAFKLTKRITWCVIDKQVGRPTPDGAGPLAAANTGFTGVRISWGIYTTSTTQQQPARPPCALFPKLRFSLSGWSVGHAPHDSGPTAQQQAGSHSIPM